MAENSVAELKAFFATPEKPLSSAEFMAFWKSLSDDEKAYFKSAELA